jgi:hypothetical protein
MYTASKAHLQAAVVILGVAGNGVAEAAACNIENAAATVKDAH